MPPPRAVEIAGLQVGGLSAGRYYFKYVLRVRAGATTTGLKYGINYTGTATAIIAVLQQLGTGTTAVSGTGDGANTAAQIVEGFTARAESTTAPNLGPTLGVDTANADLLHVIEGLIVTSDGGDLELWHASEVAASSQVMAGSMVIVTAGQ